MADEHPEVEFLDPGDGHGGADEVLWLDEEGLGTQSGGQLPPRTTTRRLVGSLLVFALGLSLTGFSGTAAYRHDKAVQAAANELILREVNVGDAVTLTDPGQFGGANPWRIEPSAEISIGVTNESPDSVTLLPGAVLTGPGLAHPSTLTPTGAKVLAPGQSGRLTGTVTVDCGVQVETFAKPGAAAGNTVLVQARTASGAVGVAALGVGQGGDPVRQQICAQEGDSLAASFFPVSVNATTHNFTVAVAARSLAAQPLKYWISTSFTSSPGGLIGGQPSDQQIEISGGRPVVPSLSAEAVGALLPGVRLSEPTPLGPIDGTIAPGASITAGYTLHVRTCPATTPTGSAELMLQMFLDDQGRPAYFQYDGFALANLVAAACGLVA